MAGDSFGQHHHIAALFSDVAHGSYQFRATASFIVWLELTIVLAGFFLITKVSSMLMPTRIRPTLQSGVYGNTFFLLTGFHGMHVFGDNHSDILLRIAKDHFTPKDHFAFQAGSWYWHFVDVVWLSLFVFVYVL